MIEATELRADKTFLMDGTPYKVLKYRHQKIARGGGNVKLTVKNLRTGDKEEKTLNSSHKVEEIDTVKKPLQYLYKDENSAYFLDPESYEQTEVPISVIEDEIDYIKEGEEVDILLWGDKPLSIDIPPKVTLEVVDAAPGVKGDTTTNVYKPATLENGVKVKVPLFIEKGDRIVFDTRTKEYVERAKKS